MATRVTLYLVVEHKSRNPSTVAVAPTTVVTAPNPQPRCDHVSAVRTLPTRLLLPADAVRFELAVAAAVPNDDRPLLLRLGLRGAAVRDLFVRNDKVSCSLPPSRSAPRSPSQSVCRPSVRERLSQ